MLLVLLVTALSASVSLPADSVRPAAKPGVARPDTTLPVPPIAAPKQPAPEVVLPIRPVTSAAHPSAPPTPAPAHPAEVVQQSAPSTTVATTSAVDAKPSTPTASVITTVTSLAASPTPTKESARVAIASAPVAKLDTTPAAPAPAAVAPTTVAPKETAVAAVPDAKQATNAKPVVDSKPTADTKATTEIKPPIVAPADALASVAATPRNVTTTRVDPRTVVSVSSSERFEPLYAVPLPTTRVRLTAPAAADSIVVYKRERTLVLFNRGVPVRNYFIALGSQPVGDKQRAGDQRTPEGLFYINAHNPASKFHLALRISYPDDAHRARAAALGVDPGGDIMIHGLPKDFSEAGKAHQQNDWTNGCVALSNQEIEEIWRAVPDGTPVHIKP